MFKEPQIGTEPVNMNRVLDVALFFKKKIDEDSVENVLEIQERWKVLSNDEKLEVQNLLTDKSPNSGPIGKMYKTLLYEYITKY